jgi:hypothetical protein
MFFCFPQTCFPFWVNDTQEKDVASADFTKINCLALLGKSKCNILDLQVFLSGTA